MNKIRRILLIARRELLYIGSRPLYMFCMILAPLFCYVFFTTLMWSGLPTDLPAGVVDLDNTSTTRSIVREWDAFQQTQVVEHYNSINEARKAMQRGEIYAFYYIPHGTTQEALSGKQPTVSFYINNAYFIAGSLLYRDQRVISELASGAIARATLYARGASEKQAMAILQPIVVESHPLNNPWLNYSVYLTNAMVPGILMLLIFLMTIYSIGNEMKNDTRATWLKMANGSISVALTGKLLPQTLIFFLMTVCYNVYLYGFLHYPCQGGILPMLAAGLLLVLASQAFGIFLMGAFTTVRLAMSAASLWGVLSFSIAGLSYPIQSMHPAVQALSWLFPLKHYFTIYTHIALNGYPIGYAWYAIVGLMVFMLLPFTIMKRLNTVLTRYEYIP